MYCYFTSELHSSDSRCETPIKRSILRRAPSDPDCCLGAGFGDWGPWGSWNATCGTRMRSRTRRCLPRGCELVGHCGGKSKEIQTVSDPSPPVALSMPRGVTGARGAYGLHHVETGHRQE